ncbi:Protein of unknown function [Pyronema omphalodes CBS 100304]|uniref:Uncharacterized protein n=1 Tax=Pyronema omphalodes (strain CBS 100304) TaxID=1076935 RepID=U4L2K0_PYROM|nr:Protein of unknown function [Pyronema omphalodes CBS 100304]
MTLTAAVAAYIIASTG